MQRIVSRNGWGGAFGLALLVAGCAGKSAVSFGEGDGGAAGAGGRATAGTGSGGQAGENGTSGGAGKAGAAGASGSAGAAGSEGSVCVVISMKAEPVPLDLFIMLDRSGSMEPSRNDSGQDRWGQVTKAIKAFVSAPVSGEVGVGLDFFPEQGAGGWVDYCDAKFYANPTVGVAPLPGVSGSIKEAIDATGPDGGTPLAEALEGAVTYAQKVKAAKPSHEVVILLATDGAPMGCNEKMPAVEAQAKRGIDAGLKTFVIGVGDDVPDLDAVAKAGGTEAALMADDGSDITALFQAKLDEIRGTVACKFQLPTPREGEELDYETAEVTFTPEGGVEEEFGQTASGTAASCGDRLSYHYDDPANPKAIVLCPKACERIKSGEGKVRIVFRCE